MELGSITSAGQTRTLRFERRLDATLEDVWAALTQPARLADWLAAATVEPGADGEITLDFAEGGKEGGRITVWDPPRALAYEWNFVGEEPSLVRWELTVVDDGRATVLTLEHTLLEPESASGYGAGWHAHLDLLEGHLTGTTPDWSARYAELRPSYEKLAGRA
jgi:uncharacterized protein YndB with AHSA1/START domain